MLSSNSDAFIVKILRISFPQMATCVFASLKAIQVGVPSKTDEKVAISGCCMCKTTRDDKLMTGIIQPDEVHEIKQINEKVAKEIDDLSRKIENLNVVYLYKLLILGHNGDSHQISLHRHGSCKST